MPHRRADLTPHLGFEGTTPSPCLCYTGTEGLHTSPHPLWVRGRSLHPLGRKSQVKLAIYAHE